MSARVLRLAGFGLVLGFVLGASRLADPAYIEQMLSLGAGPAGGARGGLLGWATLAEAAVLAGLGFKAFAGRGVPPTRSIRRGTVPGAVLFGIGWALSGTCPAAAFVQLGQGEFAAIAVVLGMLAGFSLHRVARARFGLDGSGCAGA